MYTPTHDRTELPAHLQGFLLAHDAMRRDADRLAHATEHLATGAQAKHLRRWFSRFEALIEHHHQREDELLWPDLRDRAADFGPHDEALRRDHQDLDTALVAAADALTATTDHLDSRTRDHLVATTHTLRDLLFDHLAREEDTALVRIASAFSAEEWAALEQRMASQTSLRRLAFELPWAFDGVPEESEREILAAIPAPLRFLNRVVFKPCYRRLRRALEVTR